MMQCKHDICLNKKFNSTEIRKCWLQRKNTTQSSNKGLYNSPAIVRYNTMVTDFQNEQIFYDESYITNITDADDDIMKNNDLQNIDDTEIEDTYPENKISYSIYSVICENLYNDIKNDNQISNHVIRFLLFNERGD